MNCHGCGDVSLFSPKGLKHYRLFSVWKWTQQNPLVGEKCRFVVPGPFFYGKEYHVFFFLWALHQLTSGSLRALCNPLATTFPFTCYTPTSSGNGLCQSGTNCLHWSNCSKTCTCKCTSDVPVTTDNAEEDGLQLAQKSRMCLITLYNLLHLIKYSSFLEK